MSPFSSVLLIGASGMVGSAVQTELISQRERFSKFGILTASASPSDAKKNAYFTSLEAEGIQIIKADFSDNHALVQAFTGWDAVISTVGLPLVKTQLPMIEAAAAAGVKRFMPSEFGVDLSIPSNAGEKVYAMKTMVSNRLKEVAESNENFTYTLLSIGGLAAYPFANPAIFDLDFDKCTATIIGDGQVPISLTGLTDAAAFAVAVLLHPEETKNTTIKVEGTVATWNSIINLLEKVQGKSYSVTYRSIEDARATETELWAAGNLMAARFAIRRVMAEGSGKVSVVQNDLFPEVEIETNLETIIAKELRAKGII